MINIVLVEPEIPQNTGNIIRTCAATGARLILVKPLGFSMDDKLLRRAGLDYHEFATVEYANSIEEVLAKNEGAQFYFASTKAQNSYADVSYSDNCFIVFGKESYGLKETLLSKNYEKCIRIPMKTGIRSLNLSNSVAIILFEALRQNGFSGFLKVGALTGRKED